MTEKWIAVKADFVELHNMRGVGCDAGSMWYIARKEAEVTTHLGENHKAYKVAESLSVYVFGDMVHIPIEKATGEAGAE